jgi:hypothetical protein
VPGDTTRREIMSANDDLPLLNPDPADAALDAWVTDWYLPPDDDPPAANAPVPVVPRPPTPHPGAAVLDVPVGVWLD